MNDTHAKCIGYLPETPAPWRDAAPAHHGGELVPHLRDLATRLAAESKGRPEDFAYWQAADRIDDLERALKGNEAYKAGARAERDANIERLDGLKPLESNAFLDVYRGALLDGIRCIRQGGYPNPTDLSGEAS